MFLSLSFLIITDLMVQLLSQRPITLNFGMKMTGWYDINSLESIDMKEDEPGLLESKR